MSVLETLLGKIDVDAIMTTMLAKMGVTPDQVAQIISAVVDGVRKTQELHAEAVAFKGAAGAVVKELRERMDGIDAKLTLLLTVLSVEQPRINGKAIEHGSEPNG